MMDKPVPEGRMNHSTDNLYASLGPDVFNKTQNSTGLKTTKFAEDYLIDHWI